MPQATLISVVARPVTPAHRPPQSAPTAIDAQPLDHLAVASAICGFTAIVPVLSQVAGLGLGVLSLRRIRRARRAGVGLRGTGWAVAGIGLSGFALLGWIATFAVLAWAGGLFAATAAALP